MPNPVDNRELQRDLRLLLATIDADQQRADQVLDEEPGDLSPRIRARYLLNAVRVAQKMEHEHGTEVARTAVQDALVALAAEAEEDRDPVGYIWFVARLNDDNPS